MTASQIGGAIGVAALGTLYLEFVGVGAAGHAFAVTNAAFAVIALLAAAAGHRASHAPVAESEQRMSGQAVDEPRLAS